MRSIKPGRGPSMMGGIIGIFMICFGIFWTIIAARAGGFLAIFGLLWTGIAIVNTVYNFKNATGKNRYSAYDITDSHEEPDPFNERFGSRQEGAHDAPDADSEFCPWCGTRVEDGYVFCNKCGKRLP